MSSRFRRPCASRWTTSGPGLMTGPYAPRPESRIVEPVGRCETPRHRKSLRAHMRARLHKDTVTLSVRVIPRAKRSEVVGAGGDSLKVYVTAPPEGGRANDALVAVLAEWLEVKRHQIEILAGASGRNKLVRVAGLARTGLEKLHAFNAPE